MLHGHDAEILRRPFDVAGKLIEDLDKANRQLSHRQAIALQAGDRAVAPAVSLKTDQRHSTGQARAAFQPGLLEQFLLHERIQHDRLARRLEDLRSPLNQRIKLLLVLYGVHGVSWGNRRIGVLIFAGTRETCRTFTSLIYILYTQ